MKLTENIPPILLATAALIVGLVGIRWGLPSDARNQLYFSSRPPDVPALSRDIVEQSWKYFPEFSWLPEMKDLPENLSGRTPRSVFNPIRTYHPDEYVVLKSISNMRPAHWDFDPKFYVWPSLFIYLVAAALKVASMLGLVCLKTDLGFYYERPDHMARLYLVGRLLVCFFGAAAILATYSLGKRLGDWRTGAAAGVLMLLSPLFIVNVHAMTPEIPMLLFVALALSECLRLAEPSADVQRESLRPYLRAAVAMGFAAAFKHEGLYLLPILVLAHLFRWRSLREAARHGRPLLLGLVIPPAIWFATSPYHVLHARDFLWATWRAVSCVWSPSPLPSGLVPWHMLICAVGAGVLAFAAFGAFSAGRRARALSGGFIILYPVFVITLPQYLRHYLVLLPLVVALAPASIFFLMKDNSPPRPLAVSAFCALFALVALVPLGYGAMSFLGQYTGVNTRDAAGEWIAANIPPGSTIACVSEPWQFTTPPLDARKYRVRVVGFEHANLALARPNYLILSSADFPRSYGLSPPSSEKFGFLTHLGQRRNFLKIVFERPLVRPYWPLSGQGLTWPEDMLFANPRIEIYKFDWNQ